MPVLAPITPVTGLALDQPATTDWQAFTWTSPTPVRCIYVGSPTSEIYVAVQEYTGAVVDTQIYKTVPAGRYVGIDVVVDDPGVDSITQLWVASAVGSGSRTEFELAYNRSR